MVTVPSLVDEAALDQYTATASQTDFVFNYMIFATEDIDVYVNDVLKTETTDYVVKKANGDAIVPATDLPMDGGKVVFNTGLTVDDAVSLSRGIDIERLTGYSVAGAFRADVLNAELTKQYAVMQELRRDIDRSVGLTDSDSEGGTFKLPAGRADKFLAFDSSGNMIAASGTVDGITVSPFMATVIDDTTAAAALTTLGVSAFAQTILDDATASDALTTLGVSTYAKTILDDATAGDALTTLGVSAFAQTILDDATAGDVRTTLGLAIGSDVQGYDADLADLAGLSAARGDIIYGDSGASWEKLAIGTSGQVLTSDGTDIAWGAGSSGAFEFISSATASASASIAFTDLDTSYSEYFFEFVGIKPATDGANLYIRTSSDNGSSYDAGSSDYAYVYTYSKYDVTPSHGDIGHSGTTHFQATGGIGNGTREGLTGVVRIFSLPSAENTQIFTDLSAVDSANRFWNYKGRGVRQAGVQVDAIRFLYSSGNMASGTIKLYGIKGS